MRINVTTIQRYTEGEFAFQNLRGIHAHQYRFVFSQFANNCNLNKDEKAGELKQKHYKTNPVHPH